MSSANPELPNGQMMNLFGKRGVFWYICHKELFAYQLRNLLPLFIIRV
jgi:hypothetical protein